MGLPTLKVSHVLYDVLTGGLRITMARQPIVDLHTGDVAGHELLFRVGGQPDLSPPTLWAESLRAGVLDALEDRVAQACTEDRDSSVPVFVNAHPSSYGLASRWGHIPNVVVELSEVAEIRQETVEELRSARIPIALDDVGAGYANLSTLARIMPQFIKADRFLVASCDTDAGKAAVLKALVFYAGEARATLIAEGVETDAEARRLMELGVRYGQGFLIGRPEVHRER